MEEIRKLLEETLTAEFISAVLSSPRDKEGAVKVRVRPLKKNGTLFFQMEEQRNKQAFHKNLAPEEAAESLEKAMENFRQMQIETRSLHCHVLVSKKGKVTIQKKRQGTCVKEPDFSHNRKKRYILEGKPVPFLQDLGVMTAEGRLSAPGLTNSGRLTVFWNSLRTYCPNCPRDGN